MSDKYIEVFSQFEEVTGFFSTKKGATEGYPYDREDVFEILEIIQQLGYLDCVIFISFDYDNLVYIKEKLPHQPVQFLTGQCDEALVKKLSDNGMDLDIHFRGLTPETAEVCRRYGVKINCWTVDDPLEADAMIRCGVDYITSNILE